MNRNPFAAACAVLLASSLLASCSSSSKPSAPNSSRNSPSSSAVVSSSTSGTTAATAAGIVISGFAFSGTMTVKPGQKVTVTNNDSVAHTLTDKKTHLFDTGNINGGGGTGSFTAPSKPGSYQFGCSYHPNMHGTLIVKG